MNSRIILMAATMLSSAVAADITLTDGRIFKDASVTSQTPRKVTIKHAGGLTSVAKQQLPADLQAKFPLDEAAAQAADQKAALAKENALKARQVEAERTARFLAEQEASAAASKTAADDAAAESKVQLARQAARAKTALEQYFRETYSRTLGAERTAEVTITDIRQPEGWTDRWSVTGQVVIRDYQHNQQPVNTTGMNNQESSQAQYRSAKKMAETRSFEADYTPNSSIPLNVTLR